MALFDVPICWWEKGKWLMEMGDEYTSALFEDIRKRMFFIRNLAAGDIDIVRSYGLSQDNDPDPPTWIPFTNANWSAAWAGLDDPEITITPGQYVVCFEDVGEVVDLYINKEGMTGDVFVDTPPVTAEGMLNSKWLLYPNPNNYHHFDKNTGRLEIGADQRYFVKHHTGKAGCGISAYTAIIPAYQFYPKQTDPLEQLIALKEGSQVIRRLDPILRKVEIKRDYISQTPQTHWNRTRIVADTYPAHVCVLAKRANEYVLDDGDPSGYSDEESGQDYSDPLINEAYQDQVIHTAEFQDNFSKEVDELWIRNWVHFHYNANWETDKTWARGKIVYLPEYDASPAAFIMDAFYISKQNHTSTAGTPESEKKPGTDEGDAYWATPAFQPTLFGAATGYCPAHIEYCRLKETDDQETGWGNYKVDRSEFFDCNGSAFELLLKYIDNEQPCYDWYFDTEHPFVPGWMYHEHYKSPAGQPTLYPIPRGCWRRTWRHSQNKPCHSETGAPFLMWPGELGDPPGYWEGRGYYGAGEDDWNTMCKRFIITQDDYDLLTTWFEHLYRVVDVEALYEAAIEGNGAAIERMNKRHEANQIINKPYGEGEVESIEQFEIHHNLINDMRQVLGQLNLLYSAKQVNCFSYYNGATEEIFNGDPGDLYREGKAIVENASTLVVGSDPCTYQPKIYWDEGEQKWGTVNLASWFLPRVLVYTVTSVYGPNLGKYTGGDLPIVSRDSSDFVMNFPYRGNKPDGFETNDCAQVGIEPMSACPDPDDMTQYYKFLKFPLIERVWEYDSGADTWFLREYYKVGPHNGWPLESYFEEGGLSWARSAFMYWMSGYTVGYNSEIIDYDAYDTSIFELDELNFIEL